MPEPSVSILIPCYNCARWIHRAIESAMAQTWPRSEIIVFDDGSTDDSLEIARRYQGGIRIEGSAKNSGQNVSRNRLTELAAGDWLVYLDADDELAVDSIEKKMSVADGSDAIYGTIEVACYVGSQKTRSFLLPAYGFSDPVIAAFNWQFPNTSGFMFRKSSLVSVGGWNESIKNCTDYDLYFRFLVAGLKIQNMTDSKSMYRQWSTDQAVYQDLLRRARTHLDVVWRAAKQLRSQGELNDARLSTFMRVAYSDIRTIASYDIDEAERRLADLIEWDKEFGPTGQSRAYRFIYGLAGFGAAESLANAVRPLRVLREKGAGTDPKSNLPYT